MNFELRTYIGLRFGVLNDLYSIIIFNYRTSIAKKDNYLIYYKKEDYWIFGLISFFIVFNSNKQ
jgi:hypothetical protein